MRVLCVTPKTTLQENFGKGKENHEDQQHTLLGILMCCFAAHEINHDSQYFTTVTVKGN